MFIFGYFMAILFLILALFNKKMFKMDSGFVSAMCLIIFFGLSLSLIIIQLHMQEFYPDF